MKYIIVIGGGPSGMMAAWSAKTHHPQAQVILLESNPMLGRKLALTGGGRCNVTAKVSTDEVVDYVVKNGRFLYSALNQWGPDQIIRFFESQGCPLVEEDHQRMFPASGKSQDIVATLSKALQKADVDIRLNSKVTAMDESFVYLHRGKLAYDAVILAGGSHVLPETGSDGSGFLLAESMGHSITGLLPAEVPLVSNDLFIQEKILQGLSFSDVGLQVLDEKGRRKRTITHDLLFTHFGLSGPAALRASFDVQALLQKQKTVTLIIDFLPDLAMDQLTPELIEARLPKRLLHYLAGLSAKPLHEWVKRFPMSVYETRGFAHAFVVNGGIKLKEVDPKTMQSKQNPKLSFCGEILDVSAYTGGYNITAAFSTGYLAGKYALEND